MPALAQRYLGGLARRLAPPEGGLARTLFAAAMPVRPERYVADSIFWSLAAALGALAPAAALAVAAPSGEAGAPLVAIAVALPVVAGGLAIATFLTYPHFRVSERKREIDANLPHGLSYLLALAASGLQPRALFRSLARQRVYGALAEEAEFVSRDLELLGMDILQALRLAQERTPSDKFREFLQGAISAFSSGVDLETYLRTKGEQYTREEIETQRQSLDVIGLMAETFLVVVVAAPLFLLVLLAVMSLSSGGQTILYGYVIVLGYLPLSQAGIAVVVKSLNPRVWS